MRHDDICLYLNPDDRAHLEALRAMLMSLAPYNLWLPWQQSGEVLARLFTDYEPGIHWPQSLMQSGETGINAVRVGGMIWREAAHRDQRQCKLLCERRKDL